MKKRGTTIVALGLAVIIGLTGCGGGKSGSSSTVTPSGGATPSGGEEKKVELRLGTWESGDALKHQQQIAGNYMKTHGNVNVKIEAVPDGYGTKLLTQIAAGQAPDIFQIGDGDIRMYQEKGALEDLTPYMKSIKLDDYYTSVLDVGKIDGKYYTMPKDYSDLAVFYNKKMFDEAKIPYPQAGWTWDQLYETAKKLTKKDGNKYVQWGFLLDAWAAQPMINAYGGELIKPDGSGFEGYLNSDGTVKALKMYKDMYWKDHISPSSTESEGFKGIDLFGAGKTAMSINGTWPLENYKKDPNLSFGTVRMPVGPSGAANSICYAGYGLYSKSKNKDEAWKYLNYLTGPEGQGVLAGYGLTDVKSVAEKKGQASDEYLKAFLDDIPNVRVWPEVISRFYANSGGKAYRTVLDKIKLGKPIDIKAEMDSAAKQAEADLKTLKEEQ
jgi:multiple sugar transport system substrate-binding protein